MGTDLLKKDNPAVMAIITQFLLDDGDEEEPPAELPDLTITKVVVEGNAAYVTISNIGAGEAPAVSYYLQWGYSNWPRKGYSGGTNVNPSNNKKTIHPNGSITIKAYPTNIGPGFAINYPQAIEELDYTNNCSDASGIQIVCPYLQ